MPGHDDMDTVVRKEPRDARVVSALRAAVATVTGGGEDGSDAFIPAWPIAMPSVTVMVQNSRGVAPPAETPFLTACAWRISAMLQGAASFQQVATPTNGWWICSVVSPIA